MKNDVHITGETFAHKVAAVFENEADAKAAAAEIVRETSLADTQIFVVGPNDRHPGWELEPEDRGIWKTFVRAHIWLGFFGMVFGVVLFFVLYGLSIGFVVANPLASIAIFVSFSGIFGMMLGGLITLRPDHMPYVSVATSALRRRKYVVAVHATSLSQLNEAKAQLKKFNVQTVSTL